MIDDAGRQENRLSGLKLAIEHHFIVALRGPQFVDFGRDAPHVVYASLPPHASQHFGF